MCFNQWYPIKSNQNTKQTVLIRIFILSRNRLTFQLLLKTTSFFFHFISIAFGSHPSENFFSPRYVKNYFIKMIFFVVFERFIGVSEIFRKIWIICISCHCEPRTIPKNPSTVKNQYISVTWSILKKAID